MRVWALILLMVAASYLLFSGLAFNLLLFLNLVKIG